MSQVWMAVEFCLLVVAIVVTIWACSMVSYYRTEYLSCHEEIGRLEEELAECRQMGANNVAAGTARIIAEPENWIAERRIKYLRDLLTEQVGRRDNAVRSWKIAAENWDRQVAEIKRKLEEAEAELTEGKKP